MNNNNSVSETMSISLNGFLHVFLLFTFLSVLYFLVIAPLGRKSFNNEITDQIQPSLKKIITNLSPDEKDTISSIATLKIDGKFVVDNLITKYATENKEMQTNNKWVKVIDFIIILIFFGGFMSIVLLLQYSCKKYTGIGWIVVENIISFIFIGIVEYVFFLKVASKFVPAKPSLLLNTLIDSFKDSIMMPL